MLDDSFGFVKHLRLRNPQGSGGYGDGKVIDFDAIELVDAHFYGVHELAHHHLVVIAFADDLVLQTAQRQVGFCQEVAAATGGVEEGERG